MYYGIIDNEVGILKEHKDKNKLKDLFFKKELGEVSDNIKEYKPVNKIKIFNGVKTIILFEKDITNEEILNINDLSIEECDNYIDNFTYYEGE